VTVADGKRKTTCSVPASSTRSRSGDGEVLRDTLKKKKAAVLFDASNDYSKGIAEVFRDAFRKMGGEVVAYESYGKDAWTSPPADQGESLRRGCSFPSGLYNKVGLIAKQARKRAEDPAGGPDGWDSPDLVKIAGTAIDGGYFSNHYSPDDNARGGRVGEEVQGEVRPGADALGTLAYDATNLLLEAIRKAGSDDRRRSARPSRRSGISRRSPGSHLDRNGDSIKSAAILRSRAASRSSS